MFLQMQFVYRYIIFGCDEYLKFCYCRYMVFGWDDIRFRVYSPFFLFELATKIS